MPTIENANTSLQSIKRHIKDLADERTTITPQMASFLVEMATRCYEIKGVANPMACGSSYVKGLLSNLHVKVK